MYRETASEDTLVIITRNNALGAFDRVSGRPAWQYMFGQLVSGRFWIRDCAIENGFIYAIATGSQERPGLFAVAEIVCLEYATGSLRWGQTDTLSNLWRHTKLRVDGAQVFVEYKYYTAPDGDSLSDRLEFGESGGALVSCTRGSLVVYDAATGRALWTDASGGVGKLTLPRRGRVA